MTLLRLGAACLSLLALTPALVGCDSASRIDGTETTFRTEGTDYPRAAVALSGGQIVVGALVDGTIAPADGTIGYPAVVRFSGGDTEAAVYDGGDRDFFGVDGVAPLGSGLAIAIGSDDGAEVFTTDLRGRGRSRIARLDARYLPNNALHAIPGGLAVAAFSLSPEDPHLYGLSASGAERWTYRIPEAQDLRAVSVRPDGDLVVAGPRSRAGEAIVARLSPDGAERWRVELTEASPWAISSTNDGTVLVAEQEIGGLPVLVRLDASGERLWSRTLTDTEASRATRALLLEDGRSVVGVESRNDGLESGNDARVLILSADGEIDETVEVGDPGEATTNIQGLVPLPDGRLGVVLAVGPKRIGGFGGDDFDIEVLRLDLDNP